MNLNQLRYLREVARNGLKVSDAAETLFTSQPGISKQIRLLEEELGVTILVRNGKRITDITEPGRIVLDIAERMLRDADNLRSVGREFNSGGRGTLVIATTHTQARYALPPVVARFTQRYPQVRLTLREGSPEQIATLLRNGDAEIGIATESDESFADLVTLPCAQWTRSVITPLKHPLLGAGPLTLEKIAAYPLITYDFAFTPDSPIQRAFDAAHIKPNVVLTAIAADVIKAYVEMGMGIGILAKMAFDPARDHGIRLINADHLFAPSTTRIALRRNAFLRGYAYDFIELFSAPLNRKAVAAALTAPAAD
ncbi:MAG: CysB family HTH-type transcriptional regulator [Burkholderiales bacterium]|nr:CysB family HTH-type transcriptional regulator [Burkholderiales bacterium]